MHKQQKQLLVLIIIGGIAVLSSYAQGILALAHQKGSIWGGVPAALKPLYTISMLSAAVGFFPLTTFFLWGIEPDQVQFARNWRFDALKWLYLMVLLPSALWLPLTAQMLASPGVGLWWLIRLVLFAVGLGSIGLLVAAWSHRPRREGWWRWLAIIGGVAFCFQTAILDAIVWPFYFPTP